MTVTLRPFATTSANAMLNGIVVATIVRRKAGYVVLGVDKFHPTMEDARLAVQARIVAQKLSR